MSAQMTVMEARDDFSTMINRVAFGRERIVLSRNGKAVAALVSVEDAAWLEELEDKMDAEAADAVLDKNEGTVPWEQVKAELRSGDL